MFHFSYGRVFKKKVELQQSVMWKRKFGKSDIFTYKHVCVVFDILETFWKMSSFSFGECFSASFGHKTSKRFQIYQDGSVKF